MRREIEQHEDKIRKETSLSHILSPELCSTYALCIHCTGMAEEEEEGRVDRAAG